MSRRRLGPGRVLAQPAPDRFTRAPSGRPRQHAKSHDRNPATRLPMPPGDPVSWAVLTEGTLLDGVPYPYPAGFPPHSSASPAGDRTGALPPAPGRTSSAPGPFPKGKT